MMDELRPGDWAEDLSHENGNYLSRCPKCEELFTGHRNRIVCKVCTEEYNNDQSR